MSEQDIAMLALQPRHLEMVRTTLHQYLPTAQVWAFGSRVNGSSHEASDLDLVVRNQGALNELRKGLGTVREALIESNLPIRVDLQDWALLPENFRQEIERQYVVLQAADRTAA